jgi:hypothetical protein
MITSSSKGKNVFVLDYETYNHLDDLHRVCADKLVKNGKISLFKDGNPIIPQYERCG